MRLLSIAALTLRENIRSRQTLAVAVLLACVVFGLPALIDAGEFDVTPSATLFPTLCVATLILAISALWTGAASFSSDIAGRTFQLVRVKPVSMWRIWLGKWLGLMVFNAVLLVLAFVGTAVRTFYFCSDAVRQPPIVNHVIAPVLPPIQEEVEKQIAERLIAQTNLTVKEVAKIRRILMVQAPYNTAVIAPQQSMNLRFALPRPIEAGERLKLRFQLDCSSVSRENVSALCTISHYDGRAAVTDEARCVSMAVTNFFARELELDFDASPLTASSTLVLNLANTGVADSGSIIVQPRNGISLLIKAQSFTVNLLRACLVVFCTLSLISALGLAFGALFTLPVALFCASALIVTVFVCNYAVSDLDALPPEDTNLLQPAERLELRVSSKVTASVKAISSRIYRPSPISRLAAFEYLPDQDIRDAVICNLLLLPLLMTAIASAALTQKELPE